MGKFNTELVDMGSLKMDNLESKMGYHCIG
jgi:hypothetical protein